MSEIRKIGNTNWLLDFEEAKELARKERKPILLQFEIEKCGGCKKMYSHTYLDEKVSQELSSRFILLMLNIREAHKVRREYAAYWTPSFYFLDYNGKSYYTFKGYFPPDQFRIHLRIGFSEASIPKGRFKEAMEYLNSGYDDLSKNILYPKILVLKGMIDYLHDRDNLKFRAVIKSIKEQYPESPEASQYFWDE